MKPTQPLKLIAATLLVICLTYAPARSAFVVRHNHSQEQVTPSKTTLEIPTVASPQPAQSIDDYDRDAIRKGRMDADHYYTKWEGAKWLTFGLTFLTGGILGLIPAIACSSTSPNESHLGYPDRNLMKNEYYRDGYTKQAKRIKSRKVWGGWGLGILAAVIFVILIYAA